MKLFLLLGGNLVGTLGEHGHSLVDVARHLAEQRSVASDGSVVYFLFLFHSIYKLYLILFLIPILRVFLDLGQCGTGFGVYFLRLG